MRTAVRPAAFALGLALLAGCGPAGLPPSNIAVVPVRGTVTVGGQPVKGGLMTLTLITTEKTGNTEAKAEIKDDGSFEPRMVGDKPGLVPGKWKVSIDPVYVRDGKTARSAVPKRYTTEASDLTFDVPAAGDQNVTLTLQP